MRSIFRIRMITITIDCGASFLKGARFVDGKLEKVIQYNSPHAHRSQNIFEIEQIIFLVDYVKKMIVELSQGDKEVKLCISNEMHGFLLADQDGKPYTDYISWQTELGNVEVNDSTSVSLMLNELTLQDDILYTGMPLRGGLPSCNLLYMKRNEQLHKDCSSLYFYTLGDYILRVLSDTEPYTHPSNAAATGLYDLRINDWNKRLITFVADSNIIFPEIGTEEMVFNYDEICIHSISAIGDQQAALLGAGVKEGDISFNLGTGAQVSCIVSEAACGLGYQIRPFFNGKYLKTIPHIPAGRALNVYFRFVKSVLEQYGVVLEDAEIYDILINAERSAQDTTLVCDLSFFENAITDNTKGSIFMIDENTFTFGNLMRAVFCQIAKNLLDMADRIAPDLDKIERVVFSGGFARRMEKIRREILEHYPNIDNSVAENETLIGLYSYGEICGDFKHTLN